MTNPGDDPVASLGTSEAGHQAKQQTVRQEERHIEGKQQSTRIHRVIPPEFSDKLRREEVYRERLRGFWEAAHRNSPNPEDPAELEIFLLDMMGVSEDLNGSTDVTVGNFDVTLSNFFMVVRGVVGRGRRG